MKFEEMSKQLEMLRNEEEDAKRVIESLEETSRNSERERLKVQTLKVYDTLRSSDITGCFWLFVL